MKKSKLPRLPTFEQARKAHISALTKLMERHPLVLAVLEKFPGSEVVAVREAELPEPERETE